MVCIGAAIATQSAVNSYAHRYLGSPFLASAVSFFVGALFLLVLVLATRQPFDLSWTVVRENPWWTWLGGFTSAFALTTNVLLFKRLGSVQTSVLPIMGQIIMSLVIDQFGLFQSQRNQLTVMKLCGVFILILGTLAATGVFKPRGSKLVGRPVPEGQTLHAPGKTSAKHGNALGWQLLGIVAGALLAVQAAVNGHLGQAIGSALVSAMIAFTIACLVLLLLCLCLHVRIREGLVLAAAHTRHSWWMWLGGFLGSSYVAISAQLVPVLGTGRVIIIALFGQLVFSALIDQFGWFKAPHRNVGAIQIIGFMAMLLAIGMIDFL